MPTALKLKFHFARHVSTRHDSTRSTCRAHAFRLCQACRTARLDTLDTTSFTSSTRRAPLARHDECDSQRSLLCNLYKVMICKLFTNLLEYTLIYFILFDRTNKICVFQSIKTTKLVQASTIACSSSAMYVVTARLDTLVSTCRTCQFWRHWRHSCACLPLGITSAFKRQIWLNAWSETVVFLTSRFLTCLSVLEAWTYLHQLTVTNFVDFLCPTVIHTLISYRKNSIVPKFTREASIFQP